MVPGRVKVLPGPTIVVGTSIVVGTGTSTVLKIVVGTGTSIVVGTGTSTVDRIVVPGWVIVVGTGTSTVVGTGTSTVLKMVVGTGTSTVVGTSTSEVSVIVVGTVTSKVDVVSYVDVVYEVMVVREPEIEVVIVDAGKVVVKESISVETRKDKHASQVRIIDLLTSCGSRCKGFESLAKIPSDTWKRLTEIRFNVRGRSSSRWHL